MLKIRLLRAGAKKRPFYRIVAIDERRQRDGRALEFLGTYDSKTDPPLVTMDVARVEHWVGHGAQLSPTVRSLLVKAQKSAAAAPALAAVAEV